MTAEGKGNTMKQNGTEGKFERDARRVSEILEKGENMTSAERIELLQIFSVSYHDSGKIEDLFSCDSSCHGCEFCRIMRAAAANNPLHICGYCYDFAQENRWECVKNRHELNLKIMSSVEFTEAELQILPIGFICRFNSSGDIENEIHANNYRKIAVSHSSVKFGFWAKNVRAVENVFDKYGKPENVVFIQSSPLIGIPAKRSKYADYVFTVYPDEETLQAALQNGAAECNGKKCKECGFKCYLGTWQNGANIAELLRLPAKYRGAIVKAYNEYMERRGI